MQISFIVVALMATMSMAAPAAISPNFMVARSPTIQGGHGNSGGNYIREILTEVKARKPDADATLASEGVFKREPLTGGSGNKGPGGFKREPLTGGSGNKGPGGFKREALTGGSGNKGPGGF